MTRVHHPVPFVRRGFSIRSAMHCLWNAFLRLFFRLLYNELAWSYDIVAWLVSLGRWKAWGRTTLSHLQNGPVLELGHGPGHLLLALELRGLAPVGLDVSRHMSRQAQRRLGRASAGVPLVRGRAQALPFRKGAFGGIVATFPTGYISDPRTLEGVSCILAPEGRFVVAVGARFDGDDLVSSLLRWLYRVTGQNEPSSDACLPWLSTGGLSPHVVREEVEGTTVTLIIAERGASPAP